MATLTKKAKAIAEKVDRNKVYALNDALDLLLSLPKAKFEESVEIAVNLGVDARKSDQNVRGATVLPHGTGKTVKVAVFTQGANVEAAQAAGADAAGDQAVAAPSGGHVALCDA